MKSNFTDNKVEWWSDSEDFRSIGRKIENEPAIFQLITYSQPTWTTCFLIYVLRVNCKITMTNHKQLVFVCSDSSFFHVVNDLFVFHTHTIVCREWALFLYLRTGFLNFLVKFVFEKTTLNSRCFLSFCDMFFYVCKYWKFSLQRFKSFHRPLSNWNIYMNYHQDWNDTLNLSASPFLRYLETFFSLTRTFWETKKILCLYLRIFLKIIFNFVLCRIESCYLAIEV